MISPELLRRYPFFSFMSHEQLRQVAMITDEIAVAKGATIFTMGGRADALYWVLAGSVELRFPVVDERRPGPGKEFIVGHINPGELLSISATIPPHRLTASAVASEASRLLRIDAVALRALCDCDHALAHGLLSAVAAATLERLNATRVLLAAATAQE